MATPKIKKPATKPSAAPDDVLPADADQGVETEASAESEGSDEQLSADDGVEEVSRESVNEDKANELVKIVCHVKIEPAPTVGRISLVRDFGIEKLEDRQTYTIPRCVAEVLVDRRKASFV